MSSEKCDFWDIKVAKVRHLFLNHRSTGPTIGNCSDVFHGRAEQIPMIFTDNLKFSAVKVHCRMVQSSVGHASSKAVIWLVERPSKTCSHLEVWHHCFKEPICYLLAFQATFALSRQQTRRFHATMALSAAVFALRTKLINSTIHHVIGSSSSNTQGGQPLCKSSSKWWKHGSTKPTKSV